METWMLQLINCCFCPKGLLTKLSCCAELSRINNIYTRSKKSLPHPTLHSDSCTVVHAAIVNFLQKLTTDFNEIWWVEGQDHFLVVMQSTAKSVCPIWR